jgi:HK97 family phage major capsid protein
MELAQDAYVNGGLSGMLASSASRAYATLLDKAALYGIAGNSGNPGLNNEAGMVFRKLAAHVGTTGQAPADPSDYSITAEIVRNANAEPTGILESPQVLGTFNRLNANTVAKWWNMPNDVVNIPVYYSTVIPVTETDPASGTLPAQIGGTFSSFYMGDWSRIVIGMHLDMTTTVLNERYADQLQIGLLTAMRFSIRATHPETFVRDSGIITT